MPPFTRANPPLIPWWLLGNKHLDVETRIRMIKAKFGSPSCFKTATAMMHKDL